MNLDLFTFTARRIIGYVIHRAMLERNERNFFYFRRGLEGNYYINNFAIFVLVNCNFLMLLLMNFIRF